VLNLPINNKINRWLNGAFMRMKLKLHLGQQTQSISWSTQRLTIAGFSRLFCWVKSSAQLVVAEFFFTQKSHACRNISPV
jgi:hypothetical protein